MTLSLLELKKRKRISYPFYPDITNKIGNVFKRSDIQIVCSEFKLKKKLGSTIDTRPTNAKNLKFKKFNVTQETVDISTLDKLGG
jgi:hypothetical protein